MRHMHGGDGHIDGHTLDDIYASRNIHAEGNTHGRTDTVGQMHGETSSSFRTATPRSHFGLSPIAAQDCGIE